LCWTDILFGFIALKLKHSGMSRLIVQVRQSLSWLSQNGWLLENIS